MKRNDRSNKRFSKNIMRTLKVYFIGSAVILFVFELSSCDSAGPNRYEASTILYNTYALQLKQADSLDIALRKKPEFELLKTLRFGTHSVFVTGIHKTNETQAVVEYKVVASGDQENLQKWIDACEQMKQRLRTLPLIQGGVYFSYYRYYCDSTDNQIFNLSYNANNITQTEQWKELEQKEGDMRELMQKRTVESPQQTVLLLFYDDGWRVAKMP